MLNLLAKSVNVTQYCVFFRLHFVFSTTSYQIYFSHNYMLQERIKFSTSFQLYLFVT